MQDKPTAAASRKRSLVPQRHELDGMPNGLRRAIQVVLAISCILMLVPWCAGDPLFLPFTSKVLPSVPLISRGSVIYLIAEFPLRVIGVFFWSAILFSDTDQAQPFFIFPFWAIVGTICASALTVNAWRARATENTQMLLQSPRTRWSICGLLTMLVVVGLALRVGRPVIFGLPVTIEIVEESIFEGKPLHPPYREVYERSEYSYLGGIKIGKRTDQGVELTLGDDLRDVATGKPAGKILLNDVPRTFAVGTSTRPRYLSTFKLLPAK